MVSPKVHKRDTLRKAKAAYKKRGGPVITEKERRQIERRAELRERAERIKAKDEKRKANKGKKEKKREREREAKQRQGFKDPEPRLPQGQITLGDFLKKSKEVLHSKNSIGTDQEARDTSCDLPEEPIEKVTTVREAKRFRRVRFAEPETQHRARLPLRLKSPPLSSHLSSPQSACLEIASPLTKSTLGYHSEYEDWACLFPSDTQVGRELRECSPLLGDTASNDAQQSNSSSVRADAGEISLDTGADELFLTQSVWDCLPSDTQVQRELNESPPLLPVKLDDTDLSGTHCSPLTTGLTQGTFRLRSADNEPPNPVESFTKTSSRETGQTSNLGMDDFPEDEVESGKPASLVNSLNIQSEQWLPSSTAEVSAFFDSDIDD